MRSGFQVSTRQELEQVPLAHHVGYLLNEAANTIRALTAEHLAPLDLEPRQGGALETIAAEGPMTQRALGERLRIDRTTMVSMVDRLEARGLIRRGPNPADRRCHALEITGEGKRVLREAKQRVQAAQDQFLAPLDEEERDQLRSMLVRLYVGVPGSDAPEGGK